MVAVSLPGVASRQRGLCGLFHPVTALTTALPPTGLTSHWFKVSAVLTTPAMHGLGFLLLETTVPLDLTLSVLCQKGRQTYAVVFVDILSHRVG